MIKIVVTIILVSAFFILFFNPQFELQNKTVTKKEKVSTIEGFIKDSYSNPFIDNFIPPKYGDIGTFTAYSNIPDDHWLSGFPHEPSETPIVEDADAKLERRMRELKRT